MIYVAIIRTKMVSRMLMDVTYVLVEVNARNKSFPTKVTFNR
jgi:hypothetical protein